MILPRDLAAELLDRAVQHRAAPDHRRFLLREEAHRHDLDAVFLGGPDLLAVGFELRLQAEHDRHVRSVDVAVEHADARADLRQRDGEIDRHRRLADAALAGADRDHVLDAGQRRLAVLGRRHRLHDERRRHRDIGDAGQRADRLAHARGQRFPLRRRRRRHFHGDRDAAAIDGNVLVLDELERHHIDAEVRVRDALQRIQDRLRGHKKFSLPRA